MNQTAFESLMADTTKSIQGDIHWNEDEDHSPAVEFRSEVDSAAGYPLFVRGSYNVLAQTLSYVLIYPVVGRIYGLDMGKAHHNPKCDRVGDIHKHRWTERERDKEAYVPLDITEPVTDPVAVWRQFCEECKIRHDGIMHKPPPIQGWIAF